MSEPSAFDRADIEQALRQLNGQSNGMTVEQFAASRRKSASAPVAVSKTDYGPALKAPEHAPTASGTTEKDGSQRVPVKIVSGSTLWRWRIVTIGSYESPIAYRTALNKARVRLHDQDANEMLEKMTITESPRSIALILRSVASLGFTDDRTPYDRICERGKELGLELCPAEVGPLLCLVDPRWIKDESHQIAMERLHPNYGSPQSFMADLRDGYWALRTGHIGSFGYHENQIFVFCLPSP